MVVSSAANGVANRKMLTVDDLKKRLSDPHALDLSMSGLNVTTMPCEALTQLPKVTVIDLSANQFFKLPDAFFTFTALTHINLSNNKIVFLQPAIGDLVHLQRLDLYKNNLSLLPYTFGKLASLQWLDLRDNPLTPTLSKKAGQCLDDKQCRKCALAIVQFMRLVMEEEERRQLSQQADNSENQPPPPPVPESSVKQRKRNKKNKKSDSTEVSPNIPNGISGDHGSNDLDHSDTDSDNEADPFTPPHQPAAVVQSKRSVYTRLMPLVVYGSALTLLALVIYAIIVVITVPVQVPSPSSAQ